MLDDQKIYQEVKQLETRCRETEELIHRLELKHGRSDNESEKFRIEQELAEKQAELARLWQLLEERTPDNFAEIEQRVLVDAAYDYKQKGAYEEALAQWQQIGRRFPENVEYTGAIELINELLERKKTVRTLIKQLMRRQKEIKAIYLQVVKRLRVLGESEDDQMLLDTVEAFTGDEIDAEDFLQNWEALNDDAGHLPSSAIRFDYHKLAGRIQRGEIVIFLGSGVQQVYDREMPDEEQLADYLAQHIRMDNHRSRLPAVAEYYGCRSDYGRPSLVQELQKQLPADAKRQSIELYDSLAQTQRPLVLISSAYDDLLEQSFRRYHKPFVEVLSVIASQQGEQAISNVLLNYSDRAQTAMDFCSKDELSRRNLLEQGYSVIYKIRGTCDQEPVATPHYEERQDALTVMESDYFKFARYFDRLIPGYISKQFRTREFLFVGFRPRYWEERLLVHSIMEKRAHLRQDCLSIGEFADHFEEAYWEKCGVKRHTISIQQLDSYLQQSAAAGDAR